MADTPKRAPRRNPRRRVRSGSDPRRSPDNQNDTPRSDSGNSEAAPQRGSGSSRRGRPNRSGDGNEQRVRSANGNPRRRGGRRGGESEEAGGNNQRRRRRNDNRRPRQEGIRDATANRMAQASDNRKGNRNSGNRRGRDHRSGPPRRKGLEILKLLQQQVSIDPFERFQLETTPDQVSMRVMDLIAPIGRGQRAMIVSPPKAGKTTLLVQIANALAANHPDVKVYTLLVDERPEEVTHFRRSTETTVFAASSDMSTKEHITKAEECMNTVVEPVLAGEDVVLLLDSITRLARAYNSVQGNSGRTLSGGLDANTMLAPRQIFGAARKIEHGGSLTILGTALVDTGSRMDEVIFQEFKGTGNTELVLSRDLFEKRIFPCVDISKSGTRKEEKLYPDEMVARLHNLRRLAASYPPDKAMQGILKLMQRHKTNEELLNSLAGLE